MMPFFLDRERQKRRVIVVEQAQEIGHAELGHVVGAVLDHGLEDLGHNAGAVEGGIDAFDLDGSVGQQTCSVVVPEGDVQLAVRYVLSP